jgi:hypothetical protein
VWQMHDVGWDGWMLMSVGMVAFWALVIYGVVWLARNTGSRGPGESPDALSPTRPPSTADQATLEDTRGRSRSNCSDAVAPGPLGRAPR